MNAYMKSGGSHKTVVKPIRLNSKIEFLQFVNVGITVGLRLRVQLHVPTIVHHKETLIRKGLVKLIHDAAPDSTIFADLARVTQPPK